VTDPVKRNRNLLRKAANAKKNGNFTNRNAARAPCVSRVRRARLWTSPHPAV